MLLKISILYNKLALVKLLLRWNVSPSLHQVTGTSRGVNALHYAIVATSEADPASVESRRDLVGSLLEAGCNPWLEPPRGGTPFALAGSLGDKSDLLRMMEARSLLQINLNLTAEGVADCREQMNVYCVLAPNMHPREVQTFAPLRMYCLESNDLGRIAASMVLEGSDLSFNDSHEHPMGAMQIVLARPVLGTGFQWPQNTVTRIRLTANLVESRQKLGTLHAVLQSWKGCIPTPLIQRLLLGRTALDSLELEKQLLDSAQQGRGALQEAILFTSQSANDLQLAVERQLLRLEEGEQAAKAFDEERRHRIQRKNERRAALRAGICLRKQDLKRTQEAEHVAAEERDQASREEIAELQMRILALQRVCSSKEEQRRACKDAAWMAAEERQRRHEEEVSRNQELIETLEQEHMEATAEESRHETVMKQALAKAQVQLEFLLDQASAAAAVAPTTPDREEGRSAMPTDLEEDDTLYCCPITCDVMTDPVILVGDSQTYEREAITSWLADNSTSPLTRVVLTTQQKTLLTNYHARSAIAAWQAREQRRQGGR